MFRRRMPSGHRAPSRWAGLFAIGLALAGAAPASAAPARLTALVDPFIGTDGTGHVFPGATRPFGMVAPGPDNADRGWDFTSGYQYRAPRILGFSNTHISGAGIGELGDVLLQPAQGRRWRETSTDFSAAYDKRSESAKPGRYEVRLPSHGVRVELTATPRVALHRYRFDRGGTVQVLADLQHGILFNTEARVTASTVQVDAAAGEISGTVHSRNWVERETAFVVRFDRPITAQRTLPARPGDQAPRYLLEFEPGAGRTLQARVALSTVDVAGARRNLDAEQAKGFDQVRSEADAEWNGLLGRIRIEAPQRQQRIFYSALYRVLMHPSDIADVDGRVRGPTGQVIAAPQGQYYSTLSLWDTFRGLHPLLTLLAPERVDGIVRTLLAHHQAMGTLPLWTAWGRETWTMIGNPALPVIANAIASGFGNAGGPGAAGGSGGSDGFDAAAALAAMVATSSNDRPGAPAWAQQGWGDYDQLGYLPFDRANGEAVSKSLEYGIGDDAVARVARRLGQSATAERFERRAAGYRALFDPATRMMRGRSADGRWREPFDPLTPTSPMNNPGDYTEANAWQYTLTPALHDPEGLIALMGGRAAFEQWLDRFFSVRAPGDNRHLGQEALIGQYAHGNEPSHHIAYLYAFTDAPWKGQALIRRIAADFYTDRPNGITGNDDCGQMSAWYVLSTLGFYPVTPSRGEFVLGVPLVRRASLQLASGRSLQIEREGAPAGTGFARQTLLDGRMLSATAVPHAALAQGGRLVFQMAQAPTARR